MPKTMSLRFSSKRRGTIRDKFVYFSITSSTKGNDRSPENKQVFLNSSLVSKRFFQLVKGSQLCSPWLTKF